MIRYEENDDGDFTSLYTQGDYIFPPQSNILGCGSHENNFIKLTNSRHDMLPGLGAFTGAAHTFSNDISHNRIVPASGRKSLTPQELLFLAEPR
jgi:hypothetical protein